MNELNLDVQAGPRGFPGLDVYRGIKLVVLDVDGVLTDGRIIYDSQGVESKFFDVRDGTGVTLLLKAGLQVGLLTGRTSAVVDFRARDWRIPPALVKQGAQEKLPVYRQILHDTNVRPEESVFVGDDIIDIPVLEICGLACCPSSAHPDVRQICHAVAPMPGGRGAVRGIVEHLLKSRQDGSWDRAVNAYLRRVK